MTVAEKWSFYLHGGPPLQNRSASQWVGTHALQAINRLSGIMKSFVSDLFSTNEFWLPDAVSWTLSSWICLAKSQLLVQLLSVYQILFCSGRWVLLCNWVLFATMWYLQEVHWIYSAYYGPLKWYNSHPLFVSTPSSGISWAMWSPNLMEGAMRSSCRYLLFKIWTE